MNARPAPPPRSFARRWTRRVGIGSLLLSVLAGVLLFWLLATVAGRDSLLARVVGLLPPGSLSWESAEGTVRGPLVFHNLRYAHGGVEFTARRVLLDPDILPVLGRRLQLDLLEVEGATLSLPAQADEAFELPRWPDALPRLPMPLHISSTRLDIKGLQVSRDGEPLLDMRRLQAGELRLADDGFSLASLAMDSDRGQLTLKGEYLPARNFRMDLAGRWRVPAADELPAADLGFAAKGDLDALAFNVAGMAPERLSLDLDLRESSALPLWTLVAGSDGLQPEIFGGPAGEPWRFQLDAQGKGGAATLEGELAQGEWRAVIEPSRLRLAGQQLHAEPLLLVLPQGPLKVTGELEMDGEQSRFDARLASEGLRFEPASTEPDALPVLAAGEVHATGRFEAWTVQGEATLTRGDDQAQLELDGEGDASQLRVDRLLATTPTGTLDGKGRVVWAPVLMLELEAALAGFDPGYFVPDYPGALSGNLLASAERDDDAIWRASLQMENLRGQLRERPVSGRLAGTWAGDRGEGEAALRIGGSVIDLRGGFGARYDLQARFSPLDLDDVLAGAQGRLQGSVAITGPGAAPDVRAALDITGLRWEGQQADQLRLDGDLPARGNSGRFSASGEGLVLGGLALDRLALEGSGSLESLALSADVAGAQGELSLAGELERRGKQWHGRLQRLRLAAPRAPVLDLQAPAAFAFGPGLLQLDRSCLVAQDLDGRLCAAASDGTLTVEGESLPLSLAQPWLAGDQGLSLQAEGELDLRAQLRRAGDGRWNGEAELSSAAGALRLDEDLEQEVFSYTNLRATAALDGDSVRAELAAGLADSGSVSARVNTGRAADAALEGEFQLDVRDLAWLELFSEDLAAPVGQLQGRLALAGTRADPALSGQAQLQGFASELPGLGVKLTQGQFDLVGAADGSARLLGSVRSGEGLLKVDGSLNFRDAQAPLQLVLFGDRVTLASTPELYLVANPDLTLRWLEGRLEVRGKLQVPEARVDLEALDSSVTVSPDVVVLDPIDGPRERATPLDLDFSVTLGEDVRLKGFGLDGAMTGSLALRESPGRRATASGMLEVSGKYRAYGQALNIQRARLGFANSPYDNPTLDIRAEREFEQVTVGVQVRGTARRPETTIVSNPSMDTSEALAWLVFGRPLSTTTGNESQQLGAAALALGAGGNMVAQQLGAKLGLDEAGVSDSRNLGGAAFTVGKYVSPRLFLSYGVSLVGAGQVVTLKYLLTRGFDISVESGNESAASLNWRTER